MRNQCSSTALAASLENLSTQTPHARQIPVNAPDPQLPSVNLDAVFEFRPNWGRYQREIWDLYSGVEAKEGMSTVQSMLQTVLGRGDTSADHARQAFSLSLLRDLLLCSGSIWSRDGRLYVAWPNWSGANGRNAAQIAMKKSRELRPLNQSEIARVSPLFLEGVDGVTLGQIMREGAFNLIKASEHHPSGVPYMDAFSAALRYWSMPYRGRTGRSRKFVLTCKHRLTNNQPVIAGILEMGDEAPFCTWRDDLLGLTTKRLTDWLGSDPKPGSRINAVINTFRSYRGALLPTSDGLDFRAISAREILDRKPEFESRSAGRSLESDGNDHKVLKDQKRITYALRLARGELALLNDFTRRGDLENRELAQGVRAIHDILLPRLHMEVTICGAIPPFSVALGGKLLVNFFSHPYLLESPIDSMGTLLSWSFDESQLKSLLPTCGLLAVTTKGLYAGHSAIYNRAEFPAGDRNLRLKWLANTEGNTSTLVSTFTSNLAKVVSESMSEQRTAISQVYGSGGAKRYRALVAATSLCGLPIDLVNAAIYRPVYGAKLVQNVEEVVWAGHKPIWDVERYIGPAAFDTVAAQRWRKRWLGRAEERVQDYILCPSLTEFLLEDMNMRGVELV